MGHVPHLLLEGPWDGGSLSLAAEHRHHLEKVLRLGSGAPIHYTDGAGRTGAGTLGDGVVIRGTERDVAPPRVRLSVAVAPPASKDRLRFLVEKLSELGVAEIVWVRTRYSEGRPPGEDKAEAWVRSAVEQSRTAWKTSIRTGQIGELGGPLLVADRDGGPMPSGLSEATVLVGPEGGLAPAELPAAAVPVSLGRNVLRVETAAVVAAGLLLCR